MVISHGFISSIYMYLYVSICIYYGDTMVYPILDYGSIAFLPWFILHFFGGDSPILPSNAASPQDSVLLIRIATNREKEEHEPNGEDRRRANPTRQVPRPVCFGGWVGECFVFFVQKWWYDR